MTAAPSNPALRTGSAFAERLTIAMFCVFVPFTLGSSSMNFNDGDVSWHIAAGRWIIEHGAVPSVDIFSLTKAGKPWVPIEWLAEVVFGGAFAINGYGAVAAIVSLALVALNLVLLLYLRRRASTVQILLSMVALYLVLIPFLLARPHVLAWPLLAGWTVILLRAREQGTSPPLWAAALMLLWANVHGSWALGGAIAAAFAIEALIEARWSRKALAGWIGFGLASAFAAMLTPQGVDGFLHPLRVAQMQTLPLIVEWRPSDPGRTPLLFAVLVMVIAAALWRGLRLTPVRAMLIAGLVGLALLQMRHQSVLAIVAVLLLAKPFASQREPSVAIGPDEGRAAALWLGVLIALLALVRLVMPLVPAQNDANPRDALAAIPADLRSKPVFNGYTIGGPLILAGIRPFIDGRADLYGDTFVTDYKQIIDGDMDAFDAAAKRWKIAWTILPADDKGLLPKLDRSPQWHRLYADKAAVIHVRNDALTPPGRAD